MADCSQHRKRLLSSNRVSGNRHHSLSKVKLNGYLCLRHTVCINNNMIYLFGGADLEQRTNELYSFDPCKCSITV